MEYKQIVMGEYVFTPCKNAFNDKISYWVSKKKCTVAVYAFTPADSDDLKEQTTPGSLRAYAKYLDEVLERR